jgi:hypothetical protein
MNHPDLHPYAFLTLDRAMSYLRRNEGTDKGIDVPESVVSFINAITDDLEFSTGRRLAARSYRTPVTATFTLTTGSANATAGATSGLRERDEVAATGTAAGTLVESITSSTALVLSKPATAAGATSLTFGSGPLVIDGGDERSDEGYPVLYVEESPLVSVSAINFRDINNNLTAVSLTGMRIVSETIPGMSKVILPYGAWTVGSQNVEVECVAGYLPPLAGFNARGFDGWQQLQQLSQRMVKVLWDDFRQARGRTGNVQMLNASEYVSDFNWPADVLRGIVLFSRVG